MKRISTTASGAGLPARRRWRILAATLVLLGGCTGNAQVVHPAVSYGNLPTFLPTDSFRPDSILTGTAARPALTAEGDTVEVHTGTGTVLASVTGPEVPGEGLPHETEQTTCTWTVQLRGATESVPIDIADFTTLDQLGTVYHPTLVPGAPVPARVVAPGQTVTFELRTIMVTGEGLMRWAPGGAGTLASWDFEVETD